MPARRTNEPGSEEAPKPRACRPTSRGVGRHADAPRESVRGVVARARTRATRDQARRASAGQGREPAASTARAGDGRDGRASDRGGDGEARASARRRPAGRSGGGRSARASAMAARSLRASAEIRGQRARARGPKPSVLLPGSAVEEARNLRGAGDLRGATARPCKRSGQTHCSDRVSGRDRTSVSRAWSARVSGGLRLATRRAPKRHAAFHVLQSSADRSVDRARALRRTREVQRNQGQGRRNAAEGRRGPGPKGPGAGGARASADRRGRSRAQARARQPADGDATAGPQEASLARPLTRSGRSCSPGSSWKRPHLARGVARSLEPSSKPDRHDRRFGADAAAQRAQARGADLDERARARAAGPSRRRIERAEEPRGSRARPVPRASERP